MYEFSASVCDNTVRKAAFTETLIEFYYQFQISYLSLNFHNVTYYKFLGAESLELKGAFLAEQIVIRSVEDSDYGSVRIRTMHFTKTGFGHKIITRTAGSRSDQWFAQKWSYTARKD